MVKFIENENESALHDLLSFCMNNGCEGVNCIRNMQKQILLINFLLLDLKFFLNVTN